jgi:hypothetical protein
MNPANWTTIFFSLTLLTSGALGAGMSSTEKSTDLPPPQIIIVNGKPVELPGPHPNCDVIEFQQLAFTQHDAGNRRQVALKWLRNHGPDCRNYDLNTINNNAAIWLGTSDGIEIKALIYKLYYHTKRPVNPVVPFESNAVPQLPLTYPDKK